MNLDELIEALTDLKQSGRELGKIKVYYCGRNKDKIIDKIKVRADNSQACYDRIELISLS